MNFLTPVLVKLSREVGSAAEKSLQNRGLGLRMALGRAFGTAFGLKVGQHGKGAGARRHFHSFLFIGVTHV